jgi:acyl-CoA reductase-like NAD-dependent aldehyde dehydrogenase
MSRLEVLKTYKMYIGGQFPRSESGRYYKLLSNSGELLANVCLASKKDLKNGVSAANKVKASWANRSAFNRSQIVYRIAEVLESRKMQFVEELVREGAAHDEARYEVDLAVDRIVYYAGWCDKYQQIASSVNPVSSSYFNFSILEPIGVVGIIPKGQFGLLDLVSVIIPAIVGGNTAVVLADEKHPLVAITFAEVINASDVPAGVVNILTGKLDELVETFGSHMEIDAVIFSSEDMKQYKKIQELSISNLKRLTQYQLDWKVAGDHLDFITDLQEVKTVWHPIELNGAAGGGY